MKVLISFVNNCIIKVILEDVVQFLYLKLGMLSWQKLQLTNTEFYILALTKNWSWFSLHYYVHQKFWSPLSKKKKKKQRSLGTIYELPGLSFWINPRLVVFKFLLLNQVIFFCCIGICKSQPLLHSPHCHNLNSFNIILIWEMGKTA